MKSDIEAYIILYDVDGFFVDEMADRSVPGPVLRENLRLHQGSEPAFEVIGNPGRAPMSLPDLRDGR